jgi:hypothetical protein
MKVRLVERLGPGSIVSEMARGMEAPTQGDAPYGYVESC